MKSFRLNAPNIDDFEKKFREIILEAQRNTKELDNFEKERILMREELCSKDALLQNERKISNELRIRLKVASETINDLEEEAMRNKIDYSTLSTNYESVLKEREMLTKETLSWQTEAARLKIKIESLENALRRETEQKEKLEKTLTDFKMDNKRIIANLDMTIVKLSKEHSYLTESAKAVIQLNRRLQTFGLCSHAINERNKAEIRRLQHKLLSFSLNETKKLSSEDKLHPEIEHLCFKLKEALSDIKSSTQNHGKFEEKLNRLLDELSTNLLQISS